MGHLSRFAARGRRRLKLPTLETRLDLAFVCGLAAIAAGCGWIFAPMAPIVGGLLTVGFVWLLQRGLTAREKPAETVTRVAGELLYEPADGDDGDEF